MYVLQIVLLVKNENKFTLRNENIHNYFTKNRSYMFRVSRMLVNTSKSPYVHGAIFYNELTPC